MDIDQWATVVSAGAAVVSTVFAIASAVYSRVSKRARAQAEAHERRANESLASMKRLAAAVEYAPFQAVEEQDLVFRLTNRRAFDQEIETVENRDEFTRLLFETPVVVPAYGSETFYVITAWGSSCPSDLVLRVDGRMVHVPLVRRARD